LPAHLVPAVPAATSAADLVAGLQGLSNYAATAQNGSCRRARRIDESKDDLMMTGVAGRMTGWARPHVPEASDGILTSAGICEGFAGAGVGTKVLIFAGFAGLVAGTLAAAAVEYSKTGAERDQQVAQLTSERVQLAAAPDAELDELTQLYVSRGLSRHLARQVAIELTTHDALAAHAEAELGITPASLASPLRDALAVGAAFLGGRRPPLAGHHPDTRATESGGDLRDRPAVTGADRLDLGADLGRPPGAADRTHGSYRRSVDDDYLWRWAPVPSIIVPVFTVPRHGAYVSPDAK
jgi:hypothetical protein